MVLSHISTQIYNPNMLKGGLLTEPVQQSSYKNFQQTENKFYEIVCNKISERRLDVKVKEFYEEANVAKSTFYAHFQNSTEVRNSLEQKLENDFLGLVPVYANKSYILEVLTIYIARNRHYFLAVHRSSDRYLLTRLLRHYRYNLVGRYVKDEIFHLYILNLQNIISCWLKFGMLSQTSALEVAEQLKHVSMPRAGRLF